MKVCIITLHSIYNPGSALQAFALQEYLSLSGYESEIIDYRPIYSRIGKNKLKGILRKILYFNNEKKLKRKYDKFIRDNMRLTDKTYSSSRKLKKNPPFADIYISGSDQLWNMDYDCGNDDAYYLSFVKGEKKISYSTSIGKKVVGESEWSYILPKISTYEMLAVREKSTSEILTEKLNREVFWVCDPVFLLPVERYEKMIKSVSYGKYAVIYLSKESELLDSIVNDLKTRLGCNVILLGGSRTRCRCDFHIKDLGPYDFLSLIYGAEAVISSSFHATAFSLIFHKKFGVILPSGNSERLQSLLDLSELTSRIIRSNEDISEVYKEIEYVAVDKKLDGFIKSSKDFLCRALTGNK